MLIDIHAHLDHAQFDADLDKVISESKKAGVSAIITNGTDVKDNRRCIEIAKSHKDIVKLALGLYPIEALKMTDTEIDAELKFIESHKNQIVAIGEVGLDYYWEKDLAKQEREREIFKKIIALAEKLQKPLIVHSRDAEKDCVEMLKDCKTKVIMHCFRGEGQTMDKAIEYGFYFSIPVTIIRSKHFQKLVKKANINKLFTETDCPYLGPNPGERNVPANVALSVKKIAEIKGMDETEVQNNIWMNYQKTFN